MPEPLLRQLSSFTVFILGGAILGFALDLLRAFRLALRPRGIASFLFDLFYWLVSSAVIFPLLFLATLGELRLFVWLGLLIGAGYYFAFLHEWGFRLASRVVTPFRMAAGRYRGFLPSFRLRGCAQRRRSRMRHGLKSHGR